MLNARGSLRAVALAAVVAAAACPVARADADPASDVLLSQTIFLPFFGEQASGSAKDALKKAVDQANAGGYTIRVAVIGTKDDLGGVPGAWGKPREYAAFLGQELRFAYKNHLLVAMPAGFGFYDNGRSVVEEERALDRVSIEPGTDGLVTSAGRAVAVLAGREGVQVEAPSASSGGGGSSRVVIAVVGAVVLILIAGLPFALRAYRRRRAGTSLS